MTPETFRSIRQRAGVSQKDLAAMLGVSSAALCRFETGVAQSVAREKIRRAADYILEIVLRRSMELPQ